MFSLRPTGFKRRLVVLAGALAVSVIAAGLLWSPRHDSHSTTGSSAPTDVIGRSPVAGKIHLVAFLTTQPDIAPTASRSQAVEIKSLLTQYGSKGLTAEIVDESDASKDALINTYYDWQLGDVRLSADPAHNLAQRYSVATAPATILLDANGAVVARWSSYTLTAQTAQAITERLS